jgi:hypothetical protein
MNDLMKKAGLGMALAATALSAAAPAEAQRWRGNRGNRGGDVAAGAILGGIVGLGVGAAIASNNRGRYYDRGYYAPPRGYYAGPRRFYRGAPRGYYQNGYGYGYAPRCYTQWQWDPYYGDNVRVRVCN